MINLIERYKDMPKNLEFITSDKFQTYFWGGFGNGKTEALCQRALVLAGRFPEALGLIGRATYPELRDSTIRSFFDVCPEEMIKDYHRQDNRITLKNGAEILFRAFDDPRKILSMNLGWFLVDQLEELQEEYFLQLLGRLRSPYCRFAGGVGNPEPGWVKRRFKDNAGKDVDILFIEATTLENPHLPKDYVDNLIKNYPSFWTQRYIYGNWNTFEGQVFTEFNESIHVVDPFEIPDTWKKEFIIDYGYRNPLACIKVAIDYDDNYFIIDEHYEAEKIISYHAQKIKEMGYSKQSTCWIDPSCNAKTRTKNEIQVSIIDEFMDEGIFPIPANNNIAGFMRTNQYFKDNRLKIFRNCTNTIKEITELRWKKVKPDWQKNMPEEMEDKNNHVCLYGDTLITMADSIQKKIKEVKVGDYVIARNGIRKVLASGETNSNAELWRVYLSNGQQINGTAKHKVFTQSGDKTIDSLRYNDVLYSICENTYYFKDKIIDGTDAISLRLAGARTGGSGFMLRSGKALMGILLPDFISITKILTERIMRLKTWKRLRELNICDYICKGISKIKISGNKKWNCLSEFVRLQLHGINLKLAGNGIDNTQKKHGKLKLRLKEIVNFVAESMKHGSLLIQSIATQIATKLTCDPSVWVIGVRRLNTNAPVYNLTIDTDHNYYANGVLVANCDCINYFMNSRPQASKKPDPPHMEMQRRREMFINQNKNKKDGWYD